MTNPRVWMYGIGADKRTAKLELKVIQDCRCAGCLRRLPDPQLTAVVALPPRTV